MKSQLSVPGAPVVDAAWLEGHLNDPRVRVVDTRGTIPPPGQVPRSRRPDFLDAHVPGAQWVEWHLDLIDVDDHVPNQLARADRFEQAARRLGIGPDTLVVAYDDARSIFAGRLWWAFRAMGHDAVRVLDGGWQQWRARGMATEQGEPHAVEPGNFVARARAGLRSSIDDVRAFASGAAPGTVLVDARSRARFAGGPDQPEGGHVRGATNAPYEELVGPDGLLRPHHELAATLTAAGLDPAHPPDRVIASCGSGISASIPLLALEMLAPGAGVAASVYDGSWAEWSAAAADPSSGCTIERGAR